MSSPYRTIFVKKCTILCMFLVFLLILVIKVCRSLIRRFIVVIFFQERRIKTQNDLNWIHHLGKLDIICNVYEEILVELYRKI